ncbi:uncharacterized protein [Antedon mediterranea]|uniref:uncharacterized protein n=1 Tax=Antedon mediterranea TaxID=105859 RepID=UPI003AF9F1C7
MKLDDSFRDHYKSSLVDAWDKVSKVKIALYDNGESKLSLIFNAIGASKTEWFTKERLLNYPWKDLRTKTPAQFKMVYTRPNGNSYFAIYDVIDNCQNDKLWMGIWTFEGCTYEMTEPRPIFMYSDKNISIKATSDVIIDCYLDNGAERALSSYILKSPGVTAWDCLELCRGLDYKYAGVDILNTACYCGDSGYDAGGTTSCLGRTESDATLMMSTVKSWELYQTIADTNDPMHADSFEYNGKYYIVVQSTQDSVDRPMLTHVYKYSKSTELFEPHQSIYEPYKTLHFKLVEAYKQLYLILTPHTDVVTDAFSGLKAEFYRFEGNYFIKHFKKDTCRSHGWDTFVKDNEVYIIENNKYGETCTVNDISNGNLMIYKWT